MCDLGKVCNGIAERSESEKERTNCGSKIGTLQSALARYYWEQSRKIQCKKCEYIEEEMLR